MISLSCFCQYKFSIIDVSRKIWTLLPAFFVLKAKRFVLHTGIFAWTHVSYIEMFTKKMAVDPPCLIQTSGRYISLVCCLSFPVANVSVLHNEAPRTHTLKINYPRCVFSVFPRCVFEVLAAIWEFGVIQWLNQTAGLTEISGAQIIW